MAYNTIRYDVESGVATITLSRPGKLNAYTAEMMSELIDAFDRVDADDDVRAVVVTGEGKAFCAGADISEGVDGFKVGVDSGLRTPDGGVDYGSDAMRDGGGRMTLRIFELKKPVIGAVNGPAIGIGATMLLPMDFRLASETARFRICIRAARDRAGRSIILFSSADRRYRPGAGMVLHGPDIRCKGSPARRAGIAAASRRGSAGIGARPRARDSGQHGAGFDRADPADVVARAGDEPPDGGAPRRKPRRIFTQQQRRRRRGRCGVLRETRSPFPGPGHARHARLFPMVGEEVLPLIPPGTGNARPGCELERRAWAGAVSRRPGFAATTFCHRRRCSFPRGCCAIFALPGLLARERP